MQGIIEGQNIMLSHNSRFNMGLKERFLKIYSNLPLGVRSEIVVVLDDGPLTWEVAYIEIINDTPASKIIMEKLDRLGII